MIGSVIESRKGGGMNITILFYTWFRRGFIWSVPNRGLLTPNETKPFPPSCGCHLHSQILEFVIQVTLPTDGAMAFGAFAKAYVDLKERAAADLSHWERKRLALERLRASLDRSAEGD